MPRSRLSIARSASARRHARRDRAERSAEERLSALCTFRHQLELMFSGVPLLYRRGELPRFPVHLGPRRCGTSLGGDELLRRGVECSGHRVEYTPDVLRSR
jgi:hypothetical protein